MKLEDKPIIIKGKEVKVGSRIKVCDTWLKDMGVTYELEVLKILTGRRIYGKRSEGRNVTIPVDRIKEVLV